MRKERHTKLASHIAAANAFAKYSTAQRIDLKLVSQRRLSIEAHNSRVAENLSLLHILNYVVYTAGRFGLSLRAYSEIEGALNMGNYKEI
jgi:hypothetical protein